MSARTSTFALLAASATLGGGAYFAERNGAGPLVQITVWVVAFLVYGASTQRAWLSAWRNADVQVLAVQGSLVDTVGLEVDNIAGYEVREQVQNEH